MSISCLLEGVLPPFTHHSSAFPFVDLLCCEEAGAAGETIHVICLLNIVRVCWETRTWSELTTRHSLYLSLYITLVNPVVFRQANVLYMLSV